MDWSTVGIIAGFFVGLLIVAAVLSSIFKRKLNDALEAQRVEFEAAKKKSFGISRNVLRGQLIQNFVPIKSDAVADLNAWDFRFLGDFADFIVIDGYTDVKDGIEGAKVNRIIFVEVKSGSATMSKHQEAVREAVEAGRVEWLTVRTPADLDNW